MKVTVIKTRVVRPPKDDLWEVMKSSVSSVAERSVVVVTSKVVAIHQGRCVKREAIEKADLIKREADWYLPMDKFEAKSVPLTIKEGLLIPAAGVDVSNGNGYYVLWPEKVEEICRQTWEWVRKEYGVSEVGVVVADSHVTPLRWGVTGIGLGYWGFKSLRDYSEQKDIFGKKSLTWVQAAVVDGIANAGVMVMGEGNEQTPMAMVEDLVGVEFGEEYGGGLELKEKARYDLFKPLVDKMKWIKGEGGISIMEITELND